MPKNEIIITQMRIDKWLWAARFFKTRKLASEAVKAGKVLLNGQRVKAAKNVQINAELRINKTALIWQITVLQLPKSRRPAAEVALYYQESEESVQARLKQIEAIKEARRLMPITAQRPNKKERRHIHRFKQSI